MHIWVDADACPGVVKDILFRAAARTGVPVTLVANQPLSVPRAANVSMLQVPKGFDAADHEIVRRVSPGDLVITADIPLAAETIDKQAQALSPRGELYTRENVRAALNMRDFMDTMRSSAVEMGGGPSAFGQREKQAFANALDRFLAQQS
ncbi:MAG: YaiI/YqxD family protein [Pseudomonadota bacterium]